MMKKISTVLISMMAVFALSACDRVQVNPGEIGKKLSTSGIEPEVYESGRYWVKWNDRMIKIDTNSVLRSADVNVIMADFDLSDTGESTQKIGLDMDFIINIRYRMKSGGEVIDAMLRDMRLEGVDRISAEQMYNKYGALIVGQVSREVLGKYTPEEVLDNLDEINATLKQKVQEGFQTTPLIASDVALGPISLPKVITDRVRANKDTELSEAQARAQQRIDLLEKQNQIELAEQQAVKEEIDARSLANQNAILAASASDEVIRLRELEIRRLEIEMMGQVGGSNGNTVFFPYGAMESLGMQNRMFSQ